MSSIHGDGMERKQYCVYNQTSECFLSLGVRPDRNLIKRLKAILWRGSGLLDEGFWTIEPSSFHSTGFFSTRDFICLDEQHTVVAIFEASRTVRVQKMEGVIASVLSLPLNTIYSSQTREGDRLVICAAEEMELRLRSMPSGHYQSESLAQFVDDGQVRSQSSYLRLSQSAERRTSRRSRWPRLIAFNREHDRVAVHSVKDISESGLYLVTEDRWPVGSDVIMTLRRTDGLHTQSRIPIKVKLRVSRWGSDGVGLSFVQADIEESDLEALILN